MSAVGSAANVGPGGGASTGGGWPARYGGRRGPILAGEGERTRPAPRLAYGHPGGQRSARQRGIIEVNLRVETPRPPGMATIPKLPGRRQPGFPPRHATPLTAGAVLIQPPSVGTLPPAARPGGRRRGLVGGAAWASRFQPASRFGGRPVQAGTDGPACRLDGGRGPGRPRCRPARARSVGLTEAPLPPLKPTLEKRRPSRRGGGVGAAFPLATS